MKNGYTVVSVPLGADWRKDDNDGVAEANDDVRDDRVLRKQFAPLGFGTRMARRLPVEY